MARGKIKYTATRKVREKHGAKNRQFLQQIYQLYCQQKANIDYNSPIPQGGAHLVPCSRKGDIEMANIFDVAKYILHEKGQMSTWKLQKLCYYAQAWSLAWEAKPLYDEEFEAWINGPVCRKLYEQHKHNFMIAEEDITIGDRNKLTDDEKDTVNIVLRDYGDMQPYELRELSHSEAPWKDARHGLPDNAVCQNIITKEAMGNYYGSL